MRRLSGITLPSSQRGAALLVLLALFATAAAYMLVSSLNRGSVALALARSEKNRAVMLEAKAALIAWAASETLQTQSGGAFQPGALPCPDRNNDGNAEATCGSANRLGRLPYKTLGIDELRDTSGELLWYALSSSFRRRTANIINSDTQGQLSVSGLAPASNVIAVVLAPGMPLGTQNRSPAGTSCNNSSQACNTAANYLEGINGDTDTADYVAAAENLTDAVVANLFNDQLLVITQQDLFSIVEPVVAARIERDIVRQYIYDSDPTLTDAYIQWSDDAGQRNKSRYFDAWGAFPFAAPFADPGSSSFTGLAGTYEGLLPVVDLRPVSPFTYNWKPGSGTTIQTGGSGSISATSCYIAGTTDLKCDIVYTSGAPSMRMSGSVPDVGFSLVQLTRLPDVSCSGGCALSSRTISGQLNSAGDGIVMLDATLPDSPGPKTVTITINNSNLVSSPLISLTDAFADWFNTNQWYKLTYYAVSPNCAPGVVGGCAPAASPSYLRVDNVAAPGDNKRAVIILAGRSLNGTPRPNGTLTDYLEGKNAITGDYVFEHGLGKTTTVAGPPIAISAINDRVIVIAP